jgi:protein-tyrosine-phosphatase
MTNRSYNALFLCTGNSARSILAEAILDRIGDDRIHAFSAGSRPTGQVHPLAIEVLQEHGHDVSTLRSKSWEEFEQPGASTLDFIFTVCDRAAAEECPIWPGHPMAAHWGVADPAALEGTEGDRLALFRRTYSELERRIVLFVDTPIESLDRPSPKKRLDEIGKIETPAERETRWQPRRNLKNSHQRTPEQASGESKALSDCSLFGCFCAWSAVSLWVASPQASRVPWTA